MLNCSREVATCASRLAEVARFPLPLAALIDDRSLFGANTPLLSGVHYSKSIAGEKRESPGAKTFFMCSAQGQSGGDGNLA